VNIYEHPHEIWHLSCCPSDKDLLFTVYNTVPDFKASLWKINEADSKLEELLQLPGHEGQIKCVLWEPTQGNKSSIISIDENNMMMWDINSPKEPKTTIKLGQLQRFTVGCWNPHSEQVATAIECDIIGWDLKSGKEIYNISQAHGQFVRDVDINPNKPWYFVSGGDDCKIKFWDQRKANTPLKTFTSHSHWVWSVKYNRFMDALVLSSSTDTFVNLWNVSSLSFQIPLLGDDSDNRGNKPKQKKPTDHLVKTYDDHEDSVYSISWGSEADNWAFASLSYDGRVVFNKVPKEETEAIIE